MILSATALVLCTLRFCKRVKDSIHTDLEVEELQAELDSFQRENRILSKSASIKALINVAIDTYGTDQDIIRASMCNSMVGRTLAGQSLIED